MNKIIKKIFTNKTEIYKDLELSFYDGNVNEVLDVDYYVRKGYNFKVNPTENVIIFEKDNMYFRRNNLLKDYLITEKYNIKEKMILIENKNLHEKDFDEMGRVKLLD